MKRGRPFGSTKDDTAEILMIARYLRANPGLPVATAIGALGISKDPSIVRRLRDKINGKSNNLGVFHERKALREASPKSHVEVAHLRSTRPRTKSVGGRVPEMR